MYKINQVNQSHTSLQKSHRIQTNHKASLQQTRDSHSVPTLDMTLLCMNYIFKWCVLTWIWEIKPRHGVQHIKSGVRSCQIRHCFVADDNSLGDDVSDGENVTNQPTNDDTKDHLQCYIVMNERFSQNHILWSKCTKTITPISTFKM